jgi:hypothetical protein
VVDGELLTLTTDGTRHLEVVDSVPSATGDPFYGDLGRARYPLTLDRGMVDRACAITADGGAQVVVDVQRARSAP